MKEVMIFGKVRRDPITGDTPNHRMNANSKNRFNILAAVTVKGGKVSPLQYVVTQACTNAAIFLQFVKVLLEEGTLSRGDIFILDNCSVHVKGDNLGLAEHLLNEEGILLLTLPPYHPELNPTELVFNTLLQRLKSKRARYNSLDAEDFLDAICIELSSISLGDVAEFFVKCGYLY